VPVGTIKRHIAGKGNADKAAVIAAVKALGFDPQDDNEADALALLDWAICHRVGDPGVPSTPIGENSSRISKACKRQGTVLAPRARTTSRKTASD
jgi:hypothetical protein